MRFVVGEDVGAGAAHAGLARSNTAAGAGGHTAGGTPAVPGTLPAVPGMVPTAIVGFAVGAYDPSLPLVIDPALFVYAGFFGGPDNNRGLGIAVDDAGAAYLCGETETEKGGRDAYAVKVSPDGTRFDYIAYIGGRLDDTCFDIGVDPRATPTSRASPARPWPRGSRRPSARISATTAAATTPWSPN